MADLTNCLVKNLLKNIKNGIDLITETALMKPEWRFAA
jgi:hypothetical protein